jgi:hypothetical protein
MDDETNDTGNVITDSLVAYLLHRCDQEYPDKSTCNRMRDDYRNCNICADKVVSTVFPYLTDDEQDKVESILQNGPPVCANKTCPVR